jgi:hypothetical protein
MGITPKYAHIKIPTPNIATKKTQTQAQTLRITNCCIQTVYYPTMENLNQCNRMLKFNITNLYIYHHQKLGSHSILSETRNSHTRCLEYRQMN